MAGGKAVTALGLGKAAGVVDTQCHVSSVGGFSAMGEITLSVLNKSIDFNFSYLYMISCCEVKEESKKR